MMPISQNSSQANSLTSEQIGALWTIDDPVEGQAKLKNAIPEYPGSKDELRTQIARSSGLQGRFDEAWEELSKICNTHAPIVEIRMQIEKGGLKNSTGNRNGAKPYFLKAIELAEGGHFDFYAVSMLPT